MDEVVEKPHVGLDAIVERYVQLRDKKAELKARYDSEVRNIDLALDKCEQFLLTHLNGQGAESVKTRHGTFYKSLRTSVTVADWDVFFGWVQENQMWNMLEKRAAKVNVEEYKGVHDDLPPGLNYRAEAVVNVRRS